MELKCEHDSFVSLTANWVSENFPFRGQAFVGTLAHGNDNGKTKESILATVVRDNDSNNVKAIMKLVSY